MIGLAVIGALVLFASADESVFHGRRAEAASFPAGGDTSTQGTTLRVPSQAPKTPVFTPAPTTSIPTNTTTALTTTTTASPRVFDASTVKALTDAITAWMAANQAPGVEIAIYQPGRINWSYALGTDPATNAPVTAGTRFDIESITKTFTAALVWRAVDQGLIDADKPVGLLTAVPEFKFNQLTARQLLTHTTGIVNYRDTPEYQANAASIDTPRKALAASARQRLKFAPGSQTDYSSSNYLVLGFMLEQVTGRTYDNLVNDLIAQAGLDAIPHNAPAAGLPNYSTAGLTPTATQLAHWGVALLGDNTPQLSDMSLAAMSAINPASGFGAGLIGYCPCTKSVDGTPIWAAFGHTGGYTELQYAPGDNLAIAINVTDSIYAPDNRYDAVQTFIVQLRNIASGRSN
jgi:CubicO group peptidase (beta-lactamase class C family)